ncbi:MAG: carbohydrate ABC transporter permease [Chloroflexota bacterium]|nr:carbohydrate ABC transporter permease [Chloroflexota bacterium]
MNSRVLDRAVIYSSAVILAVWVLVPFALIAISAFTPQSRVLDYPKPLIPSSLSIASVQFFIESGGIIPSVLNSLVVALLTIVFGLALSAPAGYALARFRFRGRRAFQGVVLVAKMFPIAILAIPLAVTFVQLGLYDSLISVALVHAALALPFMILIVGGVFVAVSHEIEEAAQTLGCSRWGAFLRVALPSALPGLVAASIFAFVISWNEVFAASILTVRMRTLPAQVLASLSTSPLAFKFAAGLFMVLPAVVFILLIRRYLMKLWGPR